MRIKLVMYYLGKIALVIGFSMLLPLACSVYYGYEDFDAILESMLLAIAVGFVLFVLFRSQKDRSLRPREGFALVTFAWILAAMLGAVPYMLSGACPNFFAAFFESMSGFTTTGASVIKDVEALSMGIKMWRSLTHWLGGMGIVVLLLALVPSTGGNKMYKAEAPGNSLSEKITPKIGDASQLLWITYIAMTIVLFILLKMGGMSSFDSITQTFGTLSTGGFSTRNASIGHFDSAYIQWIITLFMFLAGSNIAFFYVLFVKQRNLFFKSEEFKSYALIIVVAVGLITCNLIIGNYYDGQSFEYILRQAAFQTTSVMTTTGFSTVNYDLWPAFSKNILITVMLIGGCSGSTSGGIKVSRLLVMCKNSWVEFSRMIHPKVISHVKLNGKPLSGNLTSNVLQFLLLYVGLIFFGGIVMSLFGLDMVESFSATVACLANVGPGFGIVGPVGNYSSIPGLGQFFLSIFMLIGRLEIYTVLVLFLPTVWKK